MASRAKKKRLYREQRQVKTNGTVLEELFKSGAKCIDITSALYRK
jgi:hypothetical protein